MLNNFDRLDEAGRGEGNATQAEGSGEAVVCPRCNRVLRVERGGPGPSWLPDPREEPTVPVWPVVGRLLGRKRSAILELARRDKLPVRVLRVGRSYRVATAELLRVLGFDDRETSVRETDRDQAG